MKNSKRKKIEQKEKKKENLESCWRKFTKQKLQDKIKDDSIENEYSVDDNVLFYVGVHWRFFDK